MTTGSPGIPTHATEFEHYFEILLNERDYSMVSNREEEIAAFIENHGAQR